MSGPDVRRREWLQTALLAGAGLALSGPAAVFARTPAVALPARTFPDGMITRVVPATGERLPAIGLGANSFSVNSPADLAQRREVLAWLARTPGSLIDTAQAYGRSERVLGELIDGLAIRDKVFLASKTPMGGDASAAHDMVEASFGNLGVDTIDLMQAHNLYRFREVLPALRRFKDAGRIRYLGVSAQASAYPELMAVMRREPLDFIQVDYSLVTRRASAPVLALAQQRGLAVLVSEPFGGRMRAGSVFSRLSARPLPDWAAQIDATSWAQVLLKYVISHPAVTVVIPGTIKLSHLQDNLGAGRGRLPDAELRKHLEQYWDGLKP